MKEPRVKQHLFTLKGVLCQKFSLTLHFGKITNIAYIEHNEKKCFTDCPRLISA